MLFDPRGVASELDADLPVGRERRLPGADPQPRHKEHVLVDPNYPSAKRDEAYESGLQVQGLNVKCRRVNSAPN